MKMLDRYREQCSVQFEDFFIREVYPRVNWRLHNISKTLYTLGMVLVLVLLWYFKRPGQSARHLYISTNLTYDVIFGIIGIIGGICLLVASFYRQVLSQSYVLQEIANELNLNYWPKSRRTTIPEGMRLVRKQGFLPKTSTDYGFWGEDKGLLVELVHARWTVERSEDSVTYHGFYVTCHLQTPVQGYTLLVSDGLTAKLRGRMSGLKRIKLEWFDFEKEFDLFSTDEQECRRIFAPDVMAAIYDLYQEMKQQAVCFVFYKDELACFYNLGPSAALVEREPLDSFFWHVFLLRRLPSLLKFKGLASPWQDRKALKKRAELHQWELSEDTADTNADAQVLPKGVDAAKANVVNKNGISPIMQCILDDQPEQLERFLAWPYVDVNQQYTRNGNSLLHLAALNGREEIVLRLLEKPELNTCTVNKENQTALEVARQRGYQDIAAILEKYPH